MEYDGDNEQHRNAYDAAFNVGEKIAEEKYDSDDITLEYGYDTTIEITCRYTDEDGNEYTESKEIDVSEYMSDVTDILDSWNADEIKEDCGELRDDYIQGYAERYADEHWTEYLPKEDEDVQALERANEKLAGLRETVCDLERKRDVLSCGLNAAKVMPPDAGIIFNTAYELVCRGCDLLRHHIKEQTEEAERLEAIVEAKQPKAEQPSDGLHETQAYNEEAQEAKQ